MKHDLLSLATNYLDAWHRKDLDAIAGHLHPEVRLVGPQAIVEGRAGVVASARRILPLLTGLRVKSAFVAGTQAIFIYDFLCAPPVGVCRTAELMTFEGELIIGVELFFDARPFEKLAPARELA